jgi:tetratricopeptide (TPR) repeat protein
MALILGVVYSPAAKWNELLFGMALLFAYCCFIEPILFAMLGTTPGKALLNIEVTTQSGDRLSFGQSITRSFGVWFYGWGTGIPIIYLFTLLRAYNNLTQKKTTTWDRRGNFHVSHGRIGPIRGAITTVIVVGLLALLGNLNSTANSRRLNSGALSEADSSSSAPSSGQGESQAIVSTERPLNLSADEAIERGDIARKNGNWDKAIADCTEAIRLKPDSALAYSERGFAYAGKHNLDKAIADLSEAIRLDPTDATAYYFRGSAYSEKDDFDKSIANLTEAIQLNPQYAQAYVGRGTDYGMKGDWDKAIADLSEAIRLDPGDALMYFGRGTAYARKDEWDKAIADCTEAIRLDPKLALAYVVRGAAYKLKGDRDKAIADYTEAKRLGFKPQ